MENKKSFLIILILVVSTHIYLFAQLKVKEEKIVIAPKPTNNNLQIKLNKVVIKKQEVKPEPVVEEKQKVVKKEIIKKKLTKTKSKNIIKKEKKRYKKKKKVVKKKIIKKKVVKKTIKDIPKEKPKEVYKEVVKPQTISPKVKKKEKEINKKVLNSITNEYLLKVKRLIEKNKKYPKSAKRLKQMGKVYLSFTIGKNGEIRNVKISKSSKYKRLNKATLKILSNIKKFDPIPKELKKSTWDITVPVVYKIVRS